MIVVTMEIGTSDRPVTKRIAASPSNSARMPEAPRKIPKGKGTGLDASHREPLHVLDREPRHRQHHQDRAACVAVKHVFRAFVSIRVMSETKSPASASKAHLPCPPTRIQPDLKGATMPDPDDRTYGGFAADLPRLLTLTGGGADDDSEGRGGGNVRCDACRDRPLTLFVRHPV
jgi:hypothetical protein